MRVVVAQVVRRHHAEPVEDRARQLEPLGEGVAVLGEEAGQHVDAVDVHVPDPREVVEPHVVEDHRRRLDAEPPANSRWNPMATLHSRPRGCPSWSRAG